LVRVFTEGSGAKPPHPAAYKTATVKDAIDYIEKKKAE
jgi:hypothetical protein